jgi:hypothetical protein
VDGTGWRDASWAEISRSSAYRNGVRMAREGCSIELGSGCPVKAAGMKDVAETVLVMLSNLNVQTIVVDRQVGHNPYVLAFKTNWNETRAMVENRESLTKVLIAGGPVEEEG